MNGSSMSSPFGTASRPRGGGVAAIRQAIEQFRRPSDDRVSSRPGRGDVRSAVLAVLAEQPMHGYQVIRAIEDSGQPKPSAGSVYPMLQLLVDEHLATAADSDGRKVYSLTESGRAAAKAAPDRAAPAALTQTSVPGRIGAIPRAGAQLAGVAAEVARNGSPQQVVDAVAALDEARRTLHSILAR